jgi:hypothetical protein
MASAQLASELETIIDDKTGEDLMESGDFWIDGIKVTYPCYTFCMALRKDRAFRGCKFGTTFISAGFVSIVWVYFPDEIYCRGVIGFGDIGVSATINKYYVEAESIANNKISGRHRQHNMMGREDVSKAVQLAKRHLRKKTLAEIVSNTAYKLSSNLSQAKDTKSEAEEEAMDALRKMLTRSGMLTAELANMVKTDYEFKDEHVREGIVAYMETIDEEIEVSARNIRIALVLVHPPHSPGAPHEITVQRGRTHLNLSTRVYSGDILRSLQDVMEETYTPETLPEDIAYKIATLNVLEGNDYVDGMGCRQSENIYYIAEDV